MRCNLRVMSESGWAGESRLVCLMRKWEGRGEDVLRSSVLMGLR